MLYYISNTLPNSISYKSNQTIWGVNLPGYSNELCVENTVRSLRHQRFYWCLDKTMMLHLHGSTVSGMTLSVHVRCIADGGLFHILWSLFFLPPFPLSLPLTFPAAWRSPGPGRAGVESSIKKWRELLLYAINVRTVRDMFFYVRSSTPAVLYVGYRIS